ncbi:MAG TPA: hypothetical protein VFO12_05915 [Sphingomicrobium sp.]|nr:hypothetical protein [Sphingomicrobium sp.]
MQFHPLLTLGAAMVALAIAAPSQAGAQGITSIASGGGGPRITPIVNGGHFQGRPVHGRRGGHHRFRGGFGGVFVVEREVPVIVEREVVREVLVPVAPEPPPAPRKPHVIGASYSSLPEGCMKLIDEGVSYYGCGGEWYRQVASGKYIAVARRL